MADQLITRTSSSGIWVRGTDVRTYALKHLVLVTTSDNLAAARLSGQKPALSRAAGSSDSFIFKEGQKKNKIKTRIAQIALMMSPRVPDPLRAPGQARAPRAPPSPEQKRIFAAASRLFDIATRLPPLNSAMSRAALKPQGRGAAPPVTSADCGLSQRGKHFPVNIVFPRETMPRKRPLILKLIVKVGARRTPTSPNQTC